MSRIHITRDEHGQIVSVRHESRSPRPGETVDPVERELAEAYDELKEQYLRGELSSEALFEACYFVRDELDRRQADSDRDEGSRDE